jgi:hypothetical protein
MKPVATITLGNRSGKYKGSLEVAITPTRDLLLTLVDEEPTALRPQECPTPVEGCVYLTPENAKLLASALRNAAEEAAS